MLTSDDLQWIRDNRAEITAGRTEPVTIVITTQTGTDPYTGEPITSTTTATVNVVWEEYSTVTNGDRSVVAGVELRQDDVKVTFDADVDLTGVSKITRQGVEYELIAIDEKGIGAVNRYECVARRVV
jgi:hypothetical protein